MINLPYLLTKLLAFDAGWTLVLFEMFFDDKTFNMSCWGDTFPFIQFDDADSILECLTVACLGLKQMRGNCDHPPEGRQFASGPERNNSQTSTEEAGLNQSGAF